MCVSQSQNNSSRNALRLPLSKFRRCGRDTHQSPEKTPRKKATFDQLVAEGYRLDLVSDYSVASQDRFAAIWTK